MCCIFFDLVKAFDTADHSVLLKRLLSYGVRGIALQLIKSFLDIRKQCAVLYSKMFCSLSNNVTCGVPQGSTLSHLLFQIYIRDLVQTTNFRVNLFADDTVLIMYSKSIEKQGWQYGTLRYASILLKSTVRFFCNGSGTVCWYAV